ncbi:DUF4429 domain-containing protein [Streptomyces liangshanensis]|uniref:DUF4429 domain-containing protein n=1 Tax=Streptomyces liangshanensis TaxID=2717324 RepID=A0A6G9H3B7_9ACTN|nr:DUF4429 domain-containing protein [Streptomyces liangshanensis]QIQ04721.1 DUF4429 domain-containing protein [Streptomyces liangshanensis]
MAEIIQKDGTWTFDGDTVRIVPGTDKGVSLLRKTLGEVAVPLGALAGVSFEAGRKSGRLRLRLRDGADPLLRIGGGKLGDAADPFQLSVEGDRAGVAEYLVDEVRNALLLDQVPTGPVERYLLPGPALPITVGAGDATVTFDGERIRLEWNWKTEESKSSGGTRTLALGEVESVEWRPSAGLENGYLRFRTAGSSPATPPKYDPYAVELWGFRKDPLMALVGAAVVARLPHPNRPAGAGAKKTLEGAKGTEREPSPAEATGLPLAATAATAATGPGGPAGEAAETTGDDHDVLLRRLRELGDLHQAGILTAEEFATAKQAVLKRL